EMTTILSLRVSGSFKIVRVPLEETDGRELRRPLSLPAAVCRAVSGSGSIRSSSDKGNMVSAGIGSATGLRLAASTRHSNAVLRGRMELSTRRWLDDPAHCAVHAALTGQQRTRGGRLGCRRAWRDASALLSGRRACTRWSAAGRTEVGRVRPG